MVPTFSVGGQTRKLGRLAPKHKPVCLKLKNYLSPNVTPKPAVDYTTKAMPCITQMYANDKYGDCGVAGAAHLLGLWSYNDNAPVLASVDEVLSVYFSITGGADSGIVLTDLLDKWQNEGLVFGGKLTKIAGRVAIDNTNKTEVMIALDLFGGLYLGAMIPESWVQSPNGGTWSADYSPPVGGHCIGGGKYDQSGLWVMTWAGLRFVPWEVFTSTQWFDEVYAILSPNWTNADNLSPGGVDVATLQADLTKLQQGILPDPNPAPASPPPTPPAPSGTKFAELTWGCYTPAAQAVITAAGINGLHLTIGVGAPNPVNGSVGFSFFDLTDYANKVLTYAQNLVAKYGPAAKNVLDKSQAFAASPNFTTAQEVYAAVQSFVATIDADSMVPTKMKTVNWGNVIDISIAVLEIVAKFL